MTRGNKNQITMQLSWSVLTADGNHLTFLQRGFMASCISTVLEGINYQGFTQDAKICSYNSSASDTAVLMSQVRSATSARNLVIVVNECGKSQLLQKVLFGLLLGSFFQSTSESAP